MADRSEGSTERPPVALERFAAALVAAWRQVETWGDGLYPPGDEASAYEAGIRKCADELEALLGAEAKP